MTLLTVGIGFPLSFALVSQFGIIGLIVTTTIVGLPSLFWSLGFIKKRYGVSVDWVSSAKILLSSAVTGVVTYLFVSLLPFSPLIRLAIGVVVFTLAFLLVAIITKTISRADLANIRQIVGGLGPLRKPLTIIFNLLEKLMPK
jgi:hypothetical protein